MTRIPPIPLDTPYEAQTHGIVVRVAPRFLEDESTPDSHRFIWAYTVEIENRRAGPVTLRRRHWEIVDAAGHRQSVSGRGVVGQEPEIPPGSAFRYTSGAPLNGPSGMMRGVYEFETEDGTILEVLIPAFSLDSPHDSARPS